MPIPVETLMKHLELDTKTSINEAYISGPLDLSNTRTKYYPTKNGTTILASWLGPMWPKGLMTAKSKHFVPV